MNQAIGNFNVTLSRARKAVRKDHKKDLRHKLYGLFKMSGKPLPKKWSEKGSTQAYWLRQVVALEAPTKKVTMELGNQAKIIDQFKANLYKTKTDQSKAKTQVNSVKNDAVKIAFMETQLKQLKRQVASSKKDIENVKNQVVNRVSGLVQSHKGNRKAEVKADYKEDHEYAEYSLDVKVKNNRGEWQSINIMLSADECMVGPNFNKDLAIKSMKEKHTTVSYFEFLPEDPDAIDWEGEVDIKSYKLTNTNMASIKLGHKKLQLKFLEQIQNYDGAVSDSQSKNCFLTYIVNTLGGQRFFKNLTMDRLVEQFQRLSIDCTDGISVNDVQRWIYEFGCQVVSLVCLDPYNEVFHHSIAKDPRYSLVVIRS
jgi:hypothetical protein